MQNRKLLVPTTKTSTARSVLLAVILVGFAGGSAFDLHALVVVTNCSSLSPSLPQPKQINASCLGAVPYSLDALDTIADPISGGFLANIILPIPSGSGPAAGAYWGMAWTTGSGAMPWVVVMSNALAYPNILNATSFYVLQDQVVGGSSITCYGVYDYSNGLAVPHLEVQLPITNRVLVSPGRFVNGTSLLSLDYGSSITLLALSSTGQLLWARNLTSPDFPTLPVPNNSGQRHLALIRHAAQTNFLLCVSATVMVGSTNTSKAALVRFDANGNIQWARTVQTPYYSTNQLAGAAGWTTTTNGDSYLWTGAGSSNNILVKVDSAGTLQWARQLPYGGSTYAVPHLVGNDDAVLMSFNPSSFIVSPPSFVYRNIFTVLDPNGNVTALAEVDAPGALNPANINYPDDFTTKSATLYFYGGFPLNPVNSVIGSCSLGLTNFNWLSFTGEAAGGSDILRRFNDGRLVYFGLNANASGMDVVLLNSNLTAQSSCQMFTPLSLSVTSPPNLIAPVAVSFSNITVQVTTPAVTINPASLVFQQITLGEQALCASAGTSLQLSLSANQAIVSWPTSATPSTLLFTTNLTTPNWATASPPPVVVGDQYVVTNSATGAAKFFRLRQP